MISVNEAKQLVTKNCCLLPSSLLKLEAACGLVLAEDIYAGINIPPFNQSAMDGYAFRFADLSTSKELTIIGEVAAGDNPQPGIPQFHAVRIFTGAAVPPGCDTVVMQEKTEVIENRVQIKDELLEEGRNVRLQGSEISSGEIALAKGTKLTPAAIGFLAGLGVTDVRVHPNPIVHLVITGNELQKPGTTLQHGHVYESNSVMLKAALTQLGIVDIRISFAKDTITDITNALNYALNGADLVLLTGGVSVGNYDFVLPATKACGIKQLFHKVAQRPGKPLYAGMKGEKLIVGLPGNPASVLTCFYVYVVTAIEVMTGKKLSTSKELILTASFSKKINLTQFLKAVYVGNEVTILQAQESFRLSSFALANCLVVLPEEKMEFTEGEKVETILLP